MPKYVFVTGGVMSSLGKGIVSSSIGKIFEAMGFEVTILKFDPYLNVDAGSQNPYQHGEVFVTDDGAETDLDLGHYERFLGNPLKSQQCNNRLTLSGSFGKGAQGRLLGRNSPDNSTPHTRNKIKNCPGWRADKSDIVIVEIGGTVGDIESQPFLEAIRQFGSEQKPEDVIYFHLTYVPCSNNWRLNQTPAFCPGVEAA